MGNWTGRVIAVVSVVAALVGVAVPVPASAGGQGAGWTGQFGSTRPDEATGLALGPDGAAYVVGWTAGTLAEQTSAGTIDAFVRKIGPDGSELWTRQFGSWDSDFARAVAADGSGDVYVVGETEGILPAQQSAGGRDAFIRKFAADGRELWTRQFGGRGGEVASCVAVSPTGEVYVVGLTGAALPDQTPSGSFDAFIRKYDGQGNERWTRQYGSETGDGARGVVVVPGGNIFVVGSTEGSLTGQPRAGGFDAYLRQYDADGQVLWTRQFGSPADDYGVGVAADLEGNPTVAGSTDGTLPGQSSAGGTEGFLRRFDAAGTARWTQQFGDGTTDESWGVAVDAAGNTNVVGTTTPSSLPGSTPSKTHCFVRRYSPVGRLVQSEEFGTDGSDTASAVALDGVGEPYVAGSTTGAFAGQRSYGERDAYARRFG